MIGTAFAAAVSAHGIWRVGTAVLQQLASVAEAPGSHGVTSLPPAARGADAVRVASRRSIHREAAMTPLADRWDGRWGGTYGRPQPRVWGSTASQFGTSSRSPYRTSGDDLFDSDSDDNEVRSVGTFRTVCVRLCDGYFFPVSFAVTPERLEHDRGVCESRCGAQGRLFVHRNPGGSFDDLRDLAGRPYSQLRTAYLYRTEYVSSCTCQPQPWEQASQDRHRLYALAAAMKKGDKDAAKEMQVLQAKVKEAAKLAGQPALLSAPGEAGRQGAAATGSAKAAEIAAREDGPLMGLGGGPAPKAKSDSGLPKSRSGSDWVKRAFDR